MGKPIITVIIPVYNAGAYLVDCFESIINQSFNEIEIICVDDGSQDNSVSIINQYAAKDKRFKFFSQGTNRGAPTARNLALKKAQGEYVSFMDADDRLPLDALIKLYKPAVKNNSDAVKGNMLVDRKNRKLKPHHLNHSYARTNINLHAGKEIQHLHQYTTYLFRLALLKEHGIFFDEDLKNFQDPVFLSNLLPHCNKITLITDIVYIRSVRSGSIISSKWNLDNYRSLICGARRACNTLLKHDFKEAAKQMAMTPGNWWFNFEQMPRRITRKECVEVFSLLRAFHNEIRMPLWDNRISNDRLKLVLSLVLLGYDNEALKMLMEKKSTRVLGRLQEIVNIYRPISLNIDDFLESLKRIF